MVQLVFDADDAAQALGQEPVEVGYSSHEGAEKADWGEDKLDVVDETHPVVYPGAGSHANKFTEALYLGSSAEAGVGCDDTRGPAPRAAPDGGDDPERRRGCGGGVPVDRLRGPLGRAPEGVLQRADRAESEDAVDAADHVVGGLARPKLCRADRRGSSAPAPPTSSAAPSSGARAASSCCSAIRHSLRSCLRFSSASITFVVVRPTWTPVAPLRLGRRRTWGQILSASASMYVRHPLVFLGIGLLADPDLARHCVPAMARCSKGSTRSASSRRARSRAARRFLLSSSAPPSHCSRSRSSRPPRVALVLRSIAEKPVHAVKPRTRTRFDASGRCSRASAVFVLAWVVLTTTLFLIPVAIWLAIRWCLLAPVATLEEDRARDVLRGSRELVQQALAADGVARRTERGDRARFWALFWARCSSSSSTHRSRRSTSWPASSTPLRCRSSGSSPRTCTSMHGRGSSSSRSSTSASCRPRSSFHGHRARGPDVTDEFSAATPSPGGEPSKGGRKAWPRTGTKLIGLVASSRR